MATVCESIRATEKPSNDNWWGLFGCMHERKPTVWLTIICMVLCFNANRFTIRRITRAERLDEAEGKAKQERWMERHAKKSSYGGSGLCAWNSCCGRNRDAYSNVCTSSCQINKLQHSLSSFHIFFPFHSVFLFNLK